MNTFESSPEQNRKRCANSIAKDDAKNIVLIAMTGIHPFQIGGPAQVGFSLARELIRNMFSVTIIFNGSENSSIILNNELIKNHTESELRPLRILNMPSIIGHPGDFFKGILKIFSALRLNTQNGVIIYNSPPINEMIFCPLISRLLGYKQIFVFHGGILNENHNLLSKILIRFQTRFFDKIVVLSNYARELAMSNGFPSYKFVKIPNGIDFIEANELNSLTLIGNPKILFVGRLAKIKDVKTLIEAISKIVGHFPDVKLYIIGDGPERRTLESLTLELELAKNIIFEGTKNPGIATRSYYSFCDVFVIPSIAENFPIVLLEALESGIPIVSTDIPGGLEELLKESGIGWLVPIGDSNAMANAIIEAVELSDAMRSSLSLKEKALAKKFEWRQIGVIYASLINEVLRDTKKL